MIPQMQEQIAAIEKTLKHLNLSLNAVAEDVTNLRQQLQVERPPTPPTVPVADLEQVQGHKNRW